MLGDFDKHSPASSNNASSLGIQVFAIPSHIANLFSTATLFLCH